MQDKEAWKSLKETHLGKMTAIFLGEMELTDCGKFEGYVRDQIRIGRRDDPYSELEKVLQYNKKWKQAYYKVEA